MKLTKGKIPKLLTKRKQTKRRLNKKIFNKNSKTFRKSRPIDLRNRTLKRLYYGGEPGEEQNQSGDQEQMGDQRQTGDQEQTREQPRESYLANDEGASEPDDNAIAQAFKILANYVASTVTKKLESGSLGPMVIAAQTQAQNQAPSAQERPREQEQPREQEEEQEQQQDQEEVGR